MSESIKWHECNQCEKKLASYKSLWRHKKICKFNVDYTSKLNYRSAICSAEQDLKGNNKETEFNAYIDQIINGSATSDQDHSQDKQLVNKGSFVSNYDQEESKPGELWKVDVDHNILNKKQKLELPVVGQLGNDDAENDIDLPL